MASIRHTYGNSDKLSWRRLLNREGSSVWRNGGVGQHLDDTSVHVQAEEHCWLSVLLHTWPLLKHPGPNFLFLDGIWCRIRIIQAQASSTVSYHSLSLVFCDCHTCTPQHSGQLLLKNVFQPTDDAISSLLLLRPVLPSLLRDRRARFLIAFETWTLPVYHSSWVLQK